jgi:glycosyltransferase involved in cell wall biosynthesis
MPNVSVILPTFNRTQYLKLAIESVFSQTHADWEMVIADDGSGEETRGYLRSLGHPLVRTLLLPHHGNPSVVRNAAIRAATGRYLAFMDSDDLWAPSKLEKQIRALQHSSARWSYTNCDLIDAGGHVVAADSRSTDPPQGWIFEAILRLSVAISMPTIVAEREIIDAIGGFDEQLRFAEWQDLCLRLALRGEAVSLREPLCRVRLHTDHYSADKLAAEMGWMQLYSKMAHLAPSPELRSYCQRMRAETSLNVARRQSEKGKHAAALTTLVMSMPFAWRYPQWWWGAAKRIARPAVPAFLMAAVRRAHLGHPRGNAR